MDISRRLSFQFFFWTKCHLILFFRVPSFSTKGDHSNFYLLKLINDIASHGYSRVFFVTQTTVPGQLFEISQYAIESVLC